MKATVLAGAHALQDARMLENPQVSRNRRGRNLERLGQFRDGAVSAGHAKEDFPSRAIGERTEDIVHIRNPLVNHSVNCYPTATLCCQYTININVNCLFG